MNGCLDVLMFKFHTPDLSYSKNVKFSWQACKAFFFFFFFLIWFGVLRPVEIISLILSQVNRKVGRKLKIPKKKHLTTRM